MQSTVIVSVYHPVTPLSDVVPRDALHYGVPTLVTPLLSNSPTCALNKADGGRRDGGA